KLICAIKPCSSGIFRATPVLAKNCGRLCSRRFGAQPACAIIDPEKERLPMATTNRTTMQVKLIDYARAPMEKLYAAFRTCYTADTPLEIWEKIETEKISRDRIREFIGERLKTGHASPLEQIVFWFAIAGVSRTLSHQFVRHRIGISFEQQSQRYVRFKQDRLGYVMPESWERAKLDDEFADLLARTSDLYAKALAAGIPAEDARFVLPNAAPTNFHVMVNFAEMLHICDLRLCVRAQWEIRRMVALMRAEIKRALPEIAVFLQPKCGENRMGYCDESVEDWKKCPLGRIRPHKSALFDLYERYGSRKAQALREEDFRAVEEEEGL
ncbi:MAG: FAD-dependent thymidylate synthase, partial [Chthoniobacterales bacterium]